VNPGELNSRLALHHQTKVDDGQGGYAPVYPGELYATVWAKVEAITARRSIEYEQTVPEVHHRITIRYRSDVVFSDQIRLGSRIFELLAPPINIDERNAYLQLLCREVVPDTEPVTEPPEPVTEPPDED